MARYTKRDQVRFISHHDQMRMFHRALRRAVIPVRMTAGFNPRPRVVFPHALEVGISSGDEVVEVELERWVAPKEFERRLGRVLGSGFELLEVKLMPPKKKGYTAHEAHFETNLPEAEFGDEPEVAAAAKKTAARIAEFLAEEQIPYERVMRKGKTRQVDLRKSVTSLELEGTKLTLKLKLGLPGGARPREVLAMVLDIDEASALALNIYKVKTVLIAP